MTVVTLVTNAGCFGGNYTGAGGLESETKLQFGDTIPNLQAECNSAQTPTGE